MKHQPPQGLDSLDYKEHIDYDLVESTNPSFGKAVVRVNVFRNHRQVRGSGVAGWYTGNGTCRRPATVHTHKYETRVLQTARTDSNPPVSSPLPQCPLFSAPCRRCSTSSRSTTPSWRRRSCW